MHRERERRRREGRRRRESERGCILSIFVKLYSI
jgi:hypothetical protein